MRELSTELRWLVHFLLLKKIVEVGVSKVATLQHQNTAKL
jgi:hypothetical protein